MRKFIMLAAALCAAGGMAVAQESAEAAAVIQNSILEGISITSEPGTTPDEKTVTCYFIFRGDKPTYFWDLKTKDKKMVFEFNDTKTGSSPIISQSEPPISEFRVEPKRVNVNAEIQGLTPEWHDQVIVTFMLDAIPKVTVTDEYAVVSFQYKWSSDASKADLYAEKQKKNIVLPITLGSVGGVGLITALAFIFWPPPPPADEAPLSTSDLPRHQTPQ